MAKRQGFTLAIVIVVLLGAVIGLNYMQSINSPTEQEVEQKQEQQQEAKRKAEQASMPKTPFKPNSLMPHIMHPPPAPVQGPDNVPPADEILGPPNSSTVVALGYTMDAATAINAKQLEGAVASVQSWANGHPNECAKIICLDLPKSQLSNPADQSLPLGLSINGKSVTDCDGNPGDPTYDEALASTVLLAVK